jgi:hypothetical protein
VFTMLFLSLQALIKPSKNKHLRNLIALCVLLTPMYSLANNHFSSWSDKTICRLAKATPDNVEYQAESTSRGLSCGGSNKKSISASSQKVAKALAGIDIENDPSLTFFKPPLKPIPTDMMYWYGHQYQIVDFNNDGFSDIIYIGVAKYTNVIDFSEMSDTSTDTGEIMCNGPCKPVDLVLPSIFFGDADGNLTYHYGSIIDNRKQPGMTAGNVILLGDYNNDSIPDIYIADSGMEDWGGYRDSYFLSQPDGTWLESSDTHLSHSNFIVYDHGAATGDIDNDGDMDIVITEMNSWGQGTSLWCLMNDGTGFLKKRKCGGADSFAFELADLDGDGDLDALIGAQEYEYSSDKSAFTGILWNDGKGKFPKHKKTLLPMHKEWGGLPEVSASDLDGDGDLDIVYSRIRKHYQGAAMQIIENLGNKKFKDHGIFVLDEEGGYIRSIFFRDVDQDGDNDIYLESHEDHGNVITDGTVLLNNGNFNFDIVKPADALMLVEDRTDAKITIKYKKRILTDEEQSVEDELAEFEASLENEPAGFDAAIAKRKAKVAAAKAKRIAEETAKAAETDTVDTGQSVDDELAAFEAELAE